MVGWIALVVRQMIRICYHKNLSCFPFDVDDIMLIILLSVLSSCQNLTLGVGRCFSSCSFASVCIMSWISVFQDAICRIQDTKIFHGVCDEKMENLTGAERVHGGRFRHFLGQVQFARDQSAASACRHETTDAQQRICSGDQHLSWCPLEETGITGRCGVQATQRWFILFLTSISVFVCVETKFNPYG